MENRTYRYYKGKPLYAFGHGLSYSTFAYKSAALSSSTAHRKDTITMKVTVKNTSKRTGDEVVQVYATAVHPPVPMPLRQLVGFQRVTLRGGETKVVEIAVPVERLRRWEEKEKRYVIDAGAYRFVAGPASDQPLLQATLTVNP